MAAWAMCPPQLPFPDRDGDGVPDGPGKPVPMDLGCASNYATSPTGCIVGRTAGFTVVAARRLGEIGAGTPDAARLPTGGLWRYHPQRKVVEVLTVGPMNLGP
jgi:hypothetical protein